MLESRVCDVALVFHAVGVFVCLRYTNSSICFILVQNGCILMFSRVSSLLNVLCRIGQWTRASIEHAPPCWCVPYKNRTFWSCRVLFARCMSLLRTGRVIRYFGRPVFACRHKYTPIRVYGDRLLCHRFAVALGDLFHWDSPYAFIFQVKWLILSTLSLADRSSSVVKVLCYKSEGRWFDPSWCQWIFHWHEILPIAISL